MAGNQLPLIGENGNIMSNKDIIIKDVFYDGRITSRGIAKLLRPYEIKATQVKVADTQYCDDSKELLKSQFENLNDALEFFDPWDGEDLFGECLTREQVNDELKRLEKFMARIDKEIARIKRKAQVVVDAAAKL
jgi:hypothetical protein